MKGPGNIPNARRPECLGSRIEAILSLAQQTSDLVIAPHELSDRTLVSLLREKLARRWSNSA